MHHAGRQEGAGMQLWRMRILMRLRAACAVHIPTPYSLQSCKPRGQQCKQPAASGSWSPCYGPRTRCRMTSTRRKGGTCNSMHSGNVRAAQKHVRNAGQRRRRVSSRLTNGAIVERQGFQCANPAGQRDDRTSVKWTANPSGTATAD